MLKIHKKFLKAFIALLVLTVLSTIFFKTFESFSSFITHHSFIIGLFCIFIGIELFQNFEELADNVIAHENEAKYHIIKHLNRLAIIIVSGIIAYIFYTLE